MKIKTLVIAAAMTALPTLSFAMGCGFGKHEQQVMSCAAGSTFDAESGTCVPMTT